MKEELVYIGKKIIEHKYNLSEKLAERLDATHPLSTEELKEKKILKWRVSIMEYFGRVLFEEYYLKSKRLYLNLLKSGRLLPVNMR
ncbi:hypothetical protein [Priestia megaterium]|uniref:hypothetical protein n=1 Tax=Priestia megaterium TaxID=1404 RepID=UPI001F50E844|nr:hypothetical protein [Priestia megaterium]